MTLPCSSIHMDHSSSSSASSCSSFLSVPSIFPCAGDFYSLLSKLLGEREDIVHVHKYNPTEAHADLVAEIDSIMQKKDLGWRRPILGYAHRDGAVLVRDRVHKFHQLESTVRPPGTKTVPARLPGSGVAVAKKQGGSWCWFTWNKTKQEWCCFSCSQVHVNAFLLTSMSSHLIAVIYLWFCRQWGHPVGLQNVVYCINWGQKTWMTGKDNLLDLQCCVITLQTFILVRKSLYWEVVLKNLGHVHRPCNGRVVRGKKGILMWACTCHFSCSAFQRYLYELCYCLQSLTFPSLTLRVTVGDLRLFSFIRHFILFFSSEKVSFMLKFLTVSSKQNHFTSIVGIQ